jgi:gas vesicle protein
MEKKSSVLVSFIIGAAVGAAVGYLLSSGKGEELLDDLKDSADNLKDELGKQMDKGKELIGELKSKTDDFVTKSHI